MLSSSPHSRETLRAHREKKRLQKDSALYAPLDKENLSPRRYSDNCHHNFMIFPSRSPPVTSAPTPGLSLAKPAKGSKSCVALAPPKMHREGKVRCAPLGSMCLIVFISQLTLEGERGEKKSKNSAEEIALWRPYQDGSGRELVP